MTTNNIYTTIHTKYKVHAPYEKQRYTKRKTSVRLSVCLSVCYSSCVSSPSASSCVVVCAGRRLPFPPPPRTVRHLPVPCLQPAPPLPPPWEQPRRTLMVGCITITVVMIMEVMMIWSSGSIIVTIVNSSTTNVDRCLTLSQQLYQSERNII